MLNFLSSKNKLNAWSIVQIPIESFEIIGIGQINPYSKLQYENEMFLTVVTFMNDSKKYDEKEGLVLSKYFTIKKCPKCRRNELVLTKIKINMDSDYLKNEEEIAFDALEENPTYKNLPSLIEAFCPHCRACFEAKIKSKDCWVREAKKIKERDLVTKAWEEYYFDKIGNFYS